MLNEYDFSNSRPNPYVASLKLAADSAADRQITRKAWLRLWKSPLDKTLSYNYNTSMDTIRFEWDENKNRLNQRKHGISFEDAASVFYDSYAIFFDDPDHSAEEDRFLIIGSTGSEKICTVSHCYRGEDEVIRIISARKATRSERAIYEKEL